jgi:hypothetical protein
MAVLHPRVPLQQEHFIHTINVSDASAFLDVREPLWGCGLPRA